MKHFLLAACAATGLWLLFGARTALAAEGVASQAHRSEHAVAQAVAHEAHERTGDERVHADSKATQRVTERHAEVARRDDGPASKGHISSATSGSPERHGKSVHGGSVAPAPDHECGECGHARGSSQQTERQAEVSRGLPAPLGGHLSADPRGAPEVLGSSSLSQTPLKGVVTSGCPGGSCSNVAAAARPGVPAASRRLARPATLARTARVAASSYLSPAPGGAAEPAPESQVISHIAPAFQSTFSPDPGLQKSTRVVGGSYRGPAEHQGRAGQVRLADHLLTLVVLTGAAATVLVALGSEVRLVLIELANGRGR